MHIKMSTVFKKVFLVTNTLYVIAAVCLLAFGLFTNKLHSYDVAGAAFFLLIAILGYFAFYKESVNLTRAYTISLLVLTAIFFLYKLTIEMTSTDTNDAIYKNWNEEKNQPGIMNQTQLLLECCGKNSADDYKIELNRPVPGSCYGIKGELHTKGCLYAYQFAKQQTVRSKTFVFWCFIILMMTSTVLSWYLIAHLTRLLNQPAT